MNKPSFWAGARLATSLALSSPTIDMTLLWCSLVDVFYTSFLMPLLVAFVANPTGFHWTSVVDIVFGGEP